MAQTNQQAIQEFEVLMLLTQIAEVLNTDKIQFRDCSIQFKEEKNVC